MNRSLLTLAVVCVPLVLAGCVEEDAADEGILDGESSGMTGDGDGDGDQEDPDACNVDSPYMGGWDIGCCQDEITPGAWAPGGVSAGSVVPDWTFTDQFGDAVRLYDFCHDAIYFEYSAVW